MQPDHAPATHPPTIRHLAARLGVALAFASPLVPVLIAAEVLADVGAPTEAERHAALERSRSLADAFMQELKGELSSAIATQGVAGAVAVCRERAPAIAQRLSQESGARVTRKAERNRNPGAGLDSLEAAEWPAFAAAPMIAPGKPRETVVVYDAEGATHLRYLRAIPTAGMCLACHGDAPSEEVRAALAQHYPDDLATGFAEGDLRGLFSIDWSIGALRAALAAPAAASAPSAP